MKRRQPATEASEKLTVKKTYAVGLEMVCPGGACGWVPEIPSGFNVAGFTPRKYEPVHKWWSFLPEAEISAASSGPQAPNRSHDPLARRNPKRRECLSDQPFLGSVNLTGTWGDVLTTRGAPSA
jgi:hypothetical protein